MREAWARCGALVLACLLAIGFPAGPAVAAQALRIGVATMQPGTIFWERFGHDAIVVDDPASAGPVSYNFGFFDLDEPGFAGRFVRGEMEYMLVALPFAQDLAYYRETGRGVSIQWLDLDPAEARALADALAVNARPENARYRYDYFADNCATRVRDALDEAFGGALRMQLQSRGQGNTYRSESVRLASPAGWMWLGFDFGLGPYADEPLSRWQEAFVPMRLADGLRAARRADGRPLVLAEEPLLPHRIAPEPRSAPRPWWPWLLAGLAVAATLAWLGRRAPRAAASLALGFWTLCGILGVLLLFLWGFTAHRAAWANHNLLLASPLCLLLWPGALRILRGRDPGAPFRWLLLAVAACGVIALLLPWLPFAPQRNAHWVALLLPVHLAMLSLWPPRTRLAAAAPAGHDAAHAT